ncbi:hypothetical protein BY458DRAFT_517484 [Sporodiniella umbellata]|nr:hypothetical protein BY458DRAFT_517484 [Sporodiniella umbellata]
MRLIRLPKELLIEIAKYLSRESVGYLCLLSQESYQIFLPLLYKHVTLGHRTQMKQLGLGLQQNRFLQKTMRESTEKMTLCFRQGGNEIFWKSIFENAPNTRTLCFRDYPSLSIQKLHQALGAMTQLTHLEFEYCGLVHAGDRKLAFDHIKQLHLTWTDFTIEAAKGLLGALPGLEHLVLRANHNRRRMDNDLALQALPQTCPKLKTLAISLQQIRESTLCHLLVFYGPTLESLKIRCEGQKVLKLIAHHARRLQHLTIKHSESDQKDITTILRNCKSLISFKMVSWPVHQVPTIVLQHVQQSPLEDIRKTFALNTDDLQVIRRLGLYPESS